MNIGFYVSGKANRLMKILDIAVSNQLFELLRSIKIVISDTSNKSLSNLCGHLNISYLELIERKGFSDNLLQTIVQKRVKYLFLFARRILKGKILEVYNNRIINFHPSLLPAFQGLNAIDKALEVGVLVTGNTAHFITEEVDNGPIIMQSLFSLREFDTYDSIMDYMVVMFFQIYEWLKQERIEIKDNKVYVREAQYKFDRFLPNLEIDINLFKKLKLDL